MASKHFCHTATHNVNGTNVTLNYISTPASNIKVLSFSKKYGTNTKKTVKQSGEYGMNASWFAMNTDNHIMNLAYHNGVRQGFFRNDSDVPVVNGITTDGFTNSVGKSIIYYRNGNALFATNVSDSTHNKVVGSTWVQGGIGLYLGHSDWYEKFCIDGENNYATDTAARSALVINTVTSTAYLVTTSNSVTVEKFRAAIMANFLIEEGNSNNYWRAILLDGGQSTQLIGENLEVTSSRPIPQMLALIDKT